MRTIAAALNTLAIVLCAASSGINFAAGNPAIGFVMAGLAIANCYCLAMNLD